MALIAVAPADQDPQAIAAQQVAMAAIAKINANDAVGFAALLTDDPTIIDETPPFQWTGSSAAAEWLSDSNAFASIDGVHTFSQSGTDLLGIANDKARFNAPYRESLSKIGEMGRGQWTFILHRIGGCWKIQEAIWTPSI